MIKEFDHVRIKKNGVTGIVVDILDRSNGERYYSVEDDIEKDGDWPIYGCYEDDLEKIDD
jgi:hypothetical protein